MENQSWQPGDRVIVSLPYGAEGRSVHFATVTRVQDPGPHQANPHRTVRVAFDDPLIYGGMGVAWVSPQVCRVEGSEPAEPERVA